MASDLASVSLRIKSMLVGTPLERPARTLRWLFNARHLFKHPELWEIYLEEQRMLAVLRRLLVAHSRGVDVGSHIGSFLSLLTQLAPEGRHTAFEPSATRSAMLKRRFPGATICPYAVSDKTGTAVFQEDWARPGESRLQQTINGSGSEATRYTVKTCRLDDVLNARDQVDLIKLDIEGGELAALIGATQVIQNFKPALIFECGSEAFLESHGLSRRELYNFVTQDLSYGVFTFADYLFAKGPMTFEEFRKCGLYPFRAFNFVALPHTPRSAGIDAP